MKKLWVRETLYLMLPILLIGGGALLKGIDLFAWAKPADPGPRRLDIIETKPMKLTPLDVSKGFDWGVVIRTKVNGEAKVPRNWARSRTTYSPVIHFDYRIGKAWKTLSWKDYRNAWTIGVGSDDYPIKVNLDNLPKAAEEVRLRGHLEVREYFTGAIPPGWTPPKNLTTLGTQQRLTLTTKPLNLVIKAAGQPVPAPKVSRETKITLIDARWFTTKMGNVASDDFYLHLRHREKKQWSSDGQHAIEKLHFFDGNGKEICIYQNNGKGAPSWGGQSYQSQERFSTNKRGSDLIIALLQYGQAPRQPWSSYKQPIRVEAEISDGTCWPTKINTIMPHEEMTRESQKKFGEPAR